ncbi:hypothetical protein A7A08_03007 [Methyloligella halotolerans]|uniref:Uncharacterized protein n=1 Tax=Methyloligella halotolerans TaxID=1177755 RepID=A0A1E2RV93_9HYPH|nr:hypothetical protein [Methyloligella halotolerans]ODA66154.1 hypothetical protein A7A08_03007 [Methyloligella halotolerans]
MKSLAPVRLLGLVVWLAAWSAVAVADCTSPDGQEGTIDYNSTTHQFEYCDQADSWQPLGGSAAPADRITSGTLTVTANSATSIVSLSAAGSTWGYLGNAVSYLPTISATSVRSRHVSSSYVQLTSATTTLTCNAGATGTMRYTSGTMQVCDGSSWGNIGIGIPTGTIAAFAASSCPTGWSEYTPARGRFLRGIDNGAGNDPEGARTPGGSQEDAAPNITGGLGIDGYIFAATGAFTTLSDAQGGNIANSSLTRRVSFDASASNAKYGAANEIRPKNVAVTFCRYAGFQSQLQTGVATLASLSDVTIGGVTAGQSLVFNGASWVPSTTSSGGGFDDLSDVDTTGATAGDVIRFDGSGWVVSTTGDDTALGDRITSGTLAVTAVSETGLINLSSNGTTWGYLAVR